MSQDIRLCFKKSDLCFKICIRFVFPDNRFVFPDNRFVFQDIRLSPFDAIHRLPLCHSVAAAQDDTGSSSHQVLKGQYKSISFYNILYNICTVCVWYLFDMLYNICIVFVYDTWSRSFQKWLKKWWAWLGRQWWMRKFNCVLGEKFSGSEKLWHSVRQTLTIQSSTPFKGLATCIFMFFFYIVFASFSLNKYVNL